MMSSNTSAPTHVDETSSSTSTHTTTAVHATFVDLCSNPVRIKKNILHFTKDPDLAMPILQLVKAKGWKNTLAHGVRATFYKDVVGSMFSPGSVLSR